MGKCKETQTGGCHCGALRFSVQGSVEAFFCHCESCRRSSGAPYIAWGRVHADRLKLLEGELTIYRSAPKVERTFCSKCGTGITYQHLDSVPDLDFLLATLDFPESVEPKYHIRIQEKLPWVGLSDDLPQYSGWRETDT